MKRFQILRWLPILPPLLFAAACGGSTSDDPAAPPVAADGSGGVTGEPAAPIRLRYNVLGNPIVGQPVGISLEIHAAIEGEQIIVHYRINDTSAMQFPESQASSVTFRATRTDEPQIEQVTVVPQREGRLFLNVSAEIERPEGSVFKSLAIPIQVAAAPSPADVNGESVGGSDGKAVSSVPPDQQ